MNIDIVVKGLRMGFFIFQSLVLGELVLEAHCKVVQLLFLVEDHF